MVEGVGSGKTPGGEEAGGRLTIGALSRAVGIPVDTLRTWERRYGVPAAARTPGGHRHYGTGEIARLRTVAALLERGVRAREALTASDHEREALLDAAGGSPALPVADAPATTAAIVAAVRRYDAAVVMRRLHAAWAQLGPVAFATRCMPPVLEAVGDGWAAGTLEVRHEHFLTERVSDLLRTVRAPLEAAASGPLVVLATLPGEAHGLGLQLASLVLVAGGCRTLNAGTELPERELLALAQDVRAKVVGISVSAASAGAVTARAVARLRRGLPRTVRLLVGGAGAPGARQGVEVPGDLDALVPWARALAGRGG